MNNVHFIDEMRKNCRQGPKTVLLSIQGAAQFVEHIACHASDELRRCEPGATLDDADISFDSGPVIKILEHMEVQRTKMSIIEGAGNATHIEEARGNQKLLGTIQACLVYESKTIDKDGRVRVGIVVRSGIERVHFMRPKL